MSGTASLLASARRHLVVSTIRPDLVAARGEGSWLLDTEGRRYLDFLSGWAVNAHGHSPEGLAEALAAQARQLVNASPAFVNPWQVRLAERLCTLSGFDKAFFANSGAEANETAIKLARRHGTRNLGGASIIVCLEGGFHGRTLATMAATGKPAWHGLFPPRIEGFRHVPPNDAAALQDALGPEVCAVLMEPVLGEGGVHPLNPEYVRRARELCDAHGSLLLFDEVQTGLGRCGDLFAFQGLGVRPDAITLGKALGAGLPVSALLVPAHLDLFEPGDLGGTWSGLAISMAAALWSVERIVAQDLPGHAREMGARLREAFEGESGLAGLGPIRGRGLLLAFELPRPCSAEFVAACRDEGLLVNAPRPSTVRLLPPLNVSCEEIDAAIGMLARAWRRVDAG